MLVAGRTPSSGKLRRLVLADLQSGACCYGLGPVVGAVGSGESFPGAEQVIEIRRVSQRNVTIGQACVPVTRLRDSVVQLDHAAGYRSALDQCVKVALRPTRSEWDRRHRRGRRRRTTVRP